MTLLNWLAGLFGYEWVKDGRDYQTHHAEADDMIDDDGWDDVHEHNPRYVLRKKS